MGEREGEEERRGGGGGGGGGGGRRESTPCSCINNCTFQINIVHFILFNARDVDNICCCGRGQLALDHLRARGHPGRLYDFKCQLAS